MNAPANFSPLSSAHFAEALAREDAAGDEARRLMQQPSFVQAAPQVAPPSIAYERLPRGTVLAAGLGRSVVLPDMDFETYSEAGFVWNDATQRWSGPEGASGNKRGLPVVGVAAYAEHPSTEVVCFAYDLKDGQGRRQWLPGMAAPLDLFAYLAAGGLVEAWNVAFEFYIWNKVCTRLYGWPPLPAHLCRCAAAKSRSYSLPGSLGSATTVLGTAVQKDKRGDALIKKFSVPQNPTKKNSARRKTIYDDPDGMAFVDYNGVDIVAEAHASARIPDLEGAELEYWLMDQRINRRGVQMDLAGIHDCVALIDAALLRYNSELHALTGGEVARASEVAKLQTWLGKYGVFLAAMDEDTIDEALDTNVKHPYMPPGCVRALEIRQAVGSAAVKKVYTMALQVTRAGRMHELFTFYGARTGRTTGNGAQPTNLPNSGPAVMHCPTCDQYSGPHHKITCPWCQTPYPVGRKPSDWGPGAVESALRAIATRNLATVEYVFGDAVAAVSGCLRGLFIAAPGHDLICSDYSSIEAVVLAALAGEQWRLDVFNTHAKIYEMSAAKISGIPFEEFMKVAGYTDEELAAPDWYKRKPANPSGKHHPMRKTIGKVAELASGYQGWVGAWKAFGAEDFMTEEEMKTAILAWRDDSPAIVEFWGGQTRRTGPRWDNVQPELYGVEGMAIAALRTPGVEYEYRGFRFLMHGDALYVRLLSGRFLTYHAPRLRPSTKPGARPWEVAISYEGNNTNQKNGPVGFIRMDTWGGRLTENFVQATARDIQWNGMLNLERAGYPIVLHVYDEDIAEVPEGFGSVQEFERIMATMPDWAAGWPIKASGGWRGPRYQK